MQVSKSVRFSFTPPCARFRAQSERKPDTRSNPTQRSWAPRWDGCRFDGRRTSGAASSWRLGAGADSVSTSSRVPLPQSPLEMISGAREAVQRGLDAGRNRQRLQLILPVNEKQYDFLASDPVDYPCNLKTEFESCCSLVKAIMEGVTGKTEFLSKRLDQGGVEGEPCCAIYPETKDFVAVVFPTSDRLNDLKSLAKGDTPLLMVNCQWNDSGQVISDFGFGPWKKAADDFLNTFENTYLLTEQRIGSPGSIDPVTGQRFITGGVLRVLLSYPSQYEVYAMATNGANQYLSTFDHKPTYQELDQLLVDARGAKLEIFDVARKASAVTSAFQGKDEEGGGESKAEAVDSGSIEGRPSDSEIDAMDVTTLRRYLTAKDLPTSGRVVKLKERLKEAFKGET
ncbi:hypothetical protein BSKO_01624 [Bryopsis sp. KO-2023]|nr:hypothetical protein BSKO_01624 [Bryopsis sp. KO-2023]